MLLIVPDSGQFAAVISGSPRSSCKGSSSASRTRCERVVAEVRLPSHVDLPAAFRQLGVNDVFDRNELTSPHRAPSGRSVRERHRARS